MAKKVQASAVEEPAEEVVMASAAVDEAVPAAGGANMRENTLEQGAIEEDGVYRARKETVPGGFLNNTCMCTCLGAEERLCCTFVCATNRRVTQNQTRCQSCLYTS